LVVSWRPRDSGRPHRLRGPDPSRGDVRAERRLHFPPPASSNPPARRAPTAGRARSVDLRPRASLGLGDVARFALQERSLGGWRPRRPLSTRPAPLWRTLVRSARHGIRPPVGEIPQRCGSRDLQVEQSAG